MNHHTHPDPELLDRLRAGLLDDAPAQKAALQAHLATCERCRRQHDWPAALQRPDPVLQRRLDQARRQALQAPARNPLRRLAPLAAVAALALVAVLLVQTGQQSAPPETRVANSSEIPDLYEDLDFYLWLSEHKPVADSST